MRSLRRQSEQSSSSGYSRPWASSAWRWPAWMLSLGFHTVLLIAVALLVESAPRNAASEPARAAGIALVQRSAEQTSYFDEGGQTATVASSPSVAASLPTPLTNWPLEPAVALPSARDGDSGPALEGSLPAASGFASASAGSGPRSGSAGALGRGQARTQVFGAEGTGTKFVYVFDRSASMLDFHGRPIAAAKAQLLRSLDDLDSVHQFQIIFYNERPTVFNPAYPQAPGIVFASNENKRLARTFIEEIRPAGGTNHIAALRLAIDMRPDVIFFLTDAGEPQLTANELADLRRRNRTGAVLHTIEFGVGPVRGGENFLQRLARQNGGQYVYINIAQLAGAE